MTNQERAIWVAIKAIRRRLNLTYGGGFPTSAHASSHEDGGGDELDVTALAGFPGGTTNFLRADGTFAAPPSGGALGDLLDYQFVRKTADESVTSSTTLQADDHLVAAIGANETWVIDFVIVHAGNETGDLKLAVSGPTGAAGQWSVIGALNASAIGSRFFSNVVGTTWDNSVSLSVGNVSTVNTVTLIRALIVNGGSAGNVTLYWAQNTSDGTATSVKQNSYLEAKRVA